jgi:hypothetical protein
MLLYWVLMILFMALAMLCMWFGSWVDPYRHSKLEHDLRRASQLKDLEGLFWLPTIICVLAGFWPISEIASKAGGQEILWALAIYIVVLVLFYWIGILEKYALPKVAKETIHF